MMFSAEFYISILIAYLLGSIPTAVWVGKIFYNVDIREKGSGNAGATNTFRVLGVKAGIPVLLIDTLKGALAVRLVNQMPDFVEGSDAWINAQLALGTAALIGHIFPVYAKFKGGKGIATLLGIFIGVAPQPTLLVMAIFLVVFLLFKYVSLASITAALAYPFVLSFVFKINTPSLIGFSIAVAILVVITHRKNIGRLMRNEENKANLKLKKSPPGS